MEFEHEEAAKMKSTWILSLAAILICAGAQTVHSRVCSQGDTWELEMNIELHHENMYVMTRKIINAGHLDQIDDLYFLGPLPREFKTAQIKTKTIQKYLGRLENRNAGVLVHAFNQAGNKLCTWLVSQDDIVHDLQEVEEHWLRSMNSELMKKLGVEGKAITRAPIPKGMEIEQEFYIGSDNWEQTIQQISDALLPPIIAKNIKSRKIDTLIIVPIAGISTIPFSLLKVEGQSLVDGVSTYISPGFYTFAENALLAKRNVESEPVVVGYGKKHPAYSMPAIPAAAKEAKIIAEYLKVDPIIDDDATSWRVTDAIKSTTGLIFVSTHGASNAADPIKGSFLLLEDGAWTAEAISKLQLSSSNPLVVLSACQTALGKKYYVGTFSLARAWNYAGASDVVMSLWNVDINSTSYMMTRFVDLVRSMPADKALLKSNTRDTIKI